MIFSENRFPLFGIMLSIISDLSTTRPGPFPAALLFLRGARYR